MSSRIPPQFEVNFTDLSDDPKERHEELVDLFGRYVFWLRNWTFAATRELARSESARQSLGTIRATKYEELASMSPDQQETALRISEATVDRFIQLFLTLLANTGTDQRIGASHCIRFKVDLEICELDNVDVIESSTINRGGKRFFADYWGRWLKLFTSK